VNLLDTTLRDWPLRARWAPDNRALDNSSQRIDRSCGVRERLNKGLAQGEME
jgi:hypothetical protein